MTAPPSSQCEHCNKSSLSLLLLRPSPVARSGPLVPPGSQAVQDAAALATGLVPARQPTESRTVLRLLRAGFVHVYVPSPPPGMNSWLVYQVTDNADLIPQGNPAFNPAQPPQACARNGHNASGMRLLTLPQAHRLGTIWLAYSANLWSDTVRARNAANPKVMQAVNLAGGSPHTFKPTAAELRTRVLECALGRFTINDAAEHDFPFASLAAAVDSLAAHMTQAAACHPRTAGKELAVVLGDAVGYATELNALRLRRFHLAQAEVAKPANAHAMASLQMIDGLRQAIIDENEARKWEATTPVISGGAFADLQRVRPHPRQWPEGTRWEPFTDRADVARHGYGMGRVIFPDHDQRAAEWVQRQSGITFDSRYRKYLDEGAIQRWQQQFEQHMKSAHAEPLARFEADWWAARQDARFNDYFALHFDEQDANSPRAPHSPGATYAQEVQRSTTPQPLAEGPVQAQYLAELRKRVTDATALGWRALVGNQAALFAHLDGYVTSQRQDKMHDIGAGVFTALSEQLSPADMRYGWLAHVGFAVSSLSITQAWAAAIAAVPAAAPVAADMALVSSALMTSQALTMARESAVRGTWLKTPVRVSIQLPLDEAMTLVRSRRAATGDTSLPSNSALKRVASQSRGRQVTLTLLSDNHELAALGGDTRAAMGSGAGTMALGNRAAAQLPMTEGTVAVTQQQFAQLLTRQPQRIQQAADAMREVALLGKGATLSLAGQIGLLGAWLNGVGFMQSLQSYQSSGDALALANMADSFFGTVAGIAQITEAAMSASMTNRLGLEVAQKTLPMLGAKVVITGMGAATGLALVIGQGIKAARARTAGNTAAFVSYTFSGTAFLGLTVTSGIQFVGAFSNFMMARGSRAAVWRLGSAAAGSAEGFLVRRGVLGIVGIGLTGWGLIFLAGGLLFEVYALLNTPDALQEHVKRSRFGVGPNNYVSLEAEFEALNQLFGRAGSPSASPLAVPADATATARP